MAEFKKGDKVQVIGNWNSRGTYYISEGVVYSCGKKEMVICDAAGKKFQGAHFHPNGDHGNRLQVIHAVQKSEAEKIALALAEQEIAWEIDHFEGCLSRNPDANHFYIESILKQRMEAVNYQPAVIWR